MAVKASTASDIASVPLRTNAASPVSPGRNTIQVAPQIAPTPTVDVSIARPCGPRPKTLSANPGNSSIKPRVPIVVTVIGEGGSGGAISIATTNLILMLEHAIYSVISPEGAASILWRDTAKAQEAATGMKITAQDMIRFGVIDQIVSEPIGGAHRDPAAAIASVDSAIQAAMDELRELDREAIRRQRWDKFLAMGRTLG